MFGIKKHYYYSFFSLTLSCLFLQHSHCMNQPKDRYTIIRNATISREQMRSLSNYAKTAPRQELIHEFANKAKQYSAEHLIRTENIDCIIRNYIMDKRKITSHPIEEIARHVIIALKE